MQMFSSLERDDCKQLSVTCKCFYDQAMNQVWKRLDSFVPMARCMSDAIVEAMPPGAGILMHQIVSSFSFYQCSQVSYRPPYVTRTSSGRRLKLIGKCFVNTPTG